MLETLLVLFTIIVVFIVIALSATVFAQQQVFTEDVCHSYYHEQAVYVPYAILMWFDEPNSGGFFYNALRSEASYWIEKPEDYNADDNTFMGVGSNFTERWEWQFNMGYLDEEKERLPFQVEIISDGVSIYRNDFKDSNKDVCTYFNFKAEVRPPELDTDDILEIAGELSRKQISSINARMRLVDESMEQVGNVMVAGLVIFGLVALYGVFRNRGLGKNMEILEERYETVIKITDDQGKHAKISEEYYDLKRIHSEKHANNILTRLKELEPFVNNVHFITDYIKKNMPNVKKIVLDEKPEHPDEYKDITQSFLRIMEKPIEIVSKVKDLRKTPDDVYSQYIHFL